MGTRLRNERLRLGLTQDEFAFIAGVTRRTQVHYELDERNPDTAYLAAVASAGVDVAYVVTGAGRMGNADLSREEVALVDNYRHAMPEDQAVLRRMGLALAKPVTGKQRNGTTGEE
ncbi:helix-turn-helix domain-containing protein [Pandoraea cepalis]|nr:helix-turn-helix transcriptional regulator [Pandoraea cepalis]